MWQNKHLSQICVSLFVVEFDIVNTCWNVLVFIHKTNLNTNILFYKSGKICLNREFMKVQGLSVPFACVGSGDPVRVLRLYTTNTLDVLLKHLLLRHMYNFPLPILLCYAQALSSETSYCYCDHVTLSACVWENSLCLWVCLSVSHCTVRCFIYCLCRR